jgi:DNA-binding transcriptional ArsR family regulator
MTYANAFSALGDPTRRAVFEQLRGGPASVGAIAERLPVSRPAVSQHLKILKAAGLVADEALGTRRLYSVDARGLAEIRGWLERFWDDQLAAFKAEAERKPAAPSRKPKRKVTR